MTLKEQLHDLKIQADELRSKKEALKEAWRKNVRETLYLQDPSKIRNVEVRSASYCDDPEDMEKRKVIEFRLDDFCTLTVGEDRDKDFDISTTGYFTHDVKDIPRLENASAMFTLAMAIIKNARDGSLVPFVLKGYKEVILSKEYLNLDAQLKEVYKASNRVQDAIRAEEKILREQEIAAKRVVGTIVKAEERYGTLIGIVTHVTPSKVKIDTFRFYDEHDEEGKVTKTAEEKSMEYIQKNRAALIDRKGGEWVKNENLIFLRNLQSD